MYVCVITRKWLIWISIFLLLLLGLNTGLGKTYGWLYIKKYTNLHNRSDEQPERKRDGGGVGDVGGALDGDAGGQPHRHQREGARQLRHQLPPDQLVVRHLGQPDDVAGPWGTKNLSVLLFCLFLFDIAIGPANGALCVVQLLALFWRGFCYRWIYEWIEKLFIVQTSIDQINNIPSK